MRRHPNHAPLRPPPCPPGPRWGPKGPNLGREGTTRRRLAANRRRHHQLAARRCAAQGASPPPEPPSNQGALPPDMGVPRSPSRRAGRSITAATGTARGFARQPAPTAEEGVGRSWVLRGPPVARGERQRGLRRRRGEERRRRRRGRAWRRWHRGRTLGAGLSVSIVLIHQTNKGKAFP
jgi:hypothetical protein